MPDVSPQTDAQAALAEAIHRLTPLDAERTQRLVGLFQARHYGARAHVTLPGAGGHDVLFVVSGLLRFYYATDDGRESNKAFVGEGGFAGPLAAAVLGTSFDYGVQALEATRVLAAPYDAFSRLVESDTAYERFTRRLTAQLLAHKEQRTRSLLLESARERYESFMQTHADLAQRVPLYHVA
ncbi:MAG: Crp/Fnr family transcriptional regulator, partial [Bacteroidota bacterium]